jgi:hypothetical protein
MMVTAITAALVVSAAPAAAQSEIISLDASRDRLTFGRTVVLSGSVTEPLAVGQTIDIVDAADQVVASAIVDDEGRFRTSYMPRKNSTLRAKWEDMASEPVTVRVKPLLTLKLKPTGLFGKAKVRGMIKPLLDGGRVSVTLLRNGRPVATRSPLLTSPRFNTSFVVRKPGRYKAMVQPAGSDLVPARARTSAFVPALPSLVPGSRGRSVKLLEKRLIALGYYLPGADRVYDTKTYDAVIAFNKIQRRARVGTVSATTWRSLADPIRPRPRLKTKRFHIEIDQTRQVLLVVDKAKVRWVLHTSTGAGGITHDGHFVVSRKLGGTSGGGLYYPSYFDGLRAIHGWPSVPTYPASHGCSRVPMWAAQWIYGLAEIGTRVIIYH